MSAKVRQHRRMVEVLWALVAFLLVITFFNICTWPLLSSRQKPPVGDTSNPPVIKNGATTELPKTIRFFIDRDAKVVFEGQRVGLAEIQKAFEDNSPNRVEIRAALPELVSLFNQCWQRSLPAHVKLKQ